MWFTFLGLGKELCALVGGRKERRKKTFRKAVMETVLRTSILEDGGWVGKGKEKTGLNAGDCAEEESRLRKGSVKGGKGGKQTRKRR